jgi:hypothetical protein
VIERTDGTREHVPPKGRPRLVHKGDRVWVHSAGAGGYGDPLQREPQRVLEDVLDGYVTLDAASRDYGVVLNSAADAVDEGATQKLRAERRARVTHPGRKAPVMPESYATAASIVPDACQKYVGMESESELACDLVERGAIRRFAQAIMDEDPIFWEPCENNKRYGGPVAPPLYPAHIFRRPFGTEDPLTKNALNPDFDGVGATASQGLPEVEPLRGYGLLNGGIEVEFFRYARHGETVKLKSRYASITGKETSKGPMIFVVIESEYRTGTGDLLIRTRRTQIRRK